MRITAPRWLRLRKIFMKMLVLLECACRNSVMRIFILRWLTLPDFCLVMLVLSECDL